MDATVAAEAQQLDAVAQYLAGLGAKLNPPPANVQLPAFTPGPLPMSKSLGTAIEQAAVGLTKWMTDAGSTMTYLGEVTGGVGKNLPAVSQQTAQRMQAITKDAQRAVPTLPARPRPAPSPPENVPGASATVTPL